MNFNYSIQHQGLVVWDGAAAHPVDIRKHVGFSFTFEVVADLAADAVFNVQAAPASDADPCVPGTFVPVAEVLTCVSDWGAQAAPQATIILPAGTKKGQICSAALPCKPDAFVQLVSTTGASVRVVATLSGPK